MILERDSRPISREHIVPLREQRVLYNCLHGFTHHQEGFRFSRYHAQRGLSFTPGFTEYLKDVSGLQGYKQLIPALGNAILEDRHVPELVLPGAHVEDIMTLLMVAHQLEGIERGIFPPSTPKKKYELIRTHPVSENGLLEAYSYLADPDSILPVLGQSLAVEQRKQIDVYAKKILQSRLFSPSIHNVAMEGKGLPRTHSVASLALLLHRMMQLRYEHSFSKRAHFDFAFSQ
jgi:hypothetical protein